MKIYRGFFLLIFTFFSVYPVVYANNSIDSLRNVLKNAKGEEKISLQLDLALEIINTQKEEALALTTLALEEAKKTKKLFQEMRAYIILGRISSMFGENKNSLDHFNSALLIANKLENTWYSGEIYFRIGSYYRGIGNEIIALENYNKSIKSCEASNNYRILGAAYSLMGTIYRVNGMYDGAIEYIIKSKMNYEKAEFKEGHAWSSYLLGLIYSDRKQYLDALTYFEDALKVYEQTAVIDGNYNGVAMCIEQIGLCNMEMAEYEKARYSFDRVLELYSESGSVAGISNAQKNLGRIEYSIGNNSQAVKYLTEALNTKKEIGDLLSQSGIYEYLGLSFIKMGDQTKGLDHLYQGLDMALANKQKKIQLDIYGQLANTFIKLNDLEKALEYRNRQIEVQDSMLTANIKMNRLQEIYEQEAKNSQLEELKTQNEINTLRIKQQRIYQFVTIAGFLIALLGSIIIFWFYREIRKRNQKLREANAAKDKLLAIISHDLRGPVGTVTSFLGQITSQFDQFSPEELKEILINLEKSSENASSLLENLLAWARSQADKIDFNPAKLNLAELLANTLESIKHVADNKEISIQKDTDDKLNIIADPDMLQTILRNLVSNAIKFTHRGKSVTIKTEINNPNKALICIIDEGVGIEKEAIENIFDINNSHHTPGTEDEKSSGLGLILVKDFVERNKGTLNIESEPGKGTVVSFTLPLAI